MAFESITGPLGGPRVDHLFAVLTAMVHNTAVDADHQRDPDEFLLRWDRGLGLPPPDMEEAGAQTHTIMSTVAGLLADEKG